MKYIANEEKIMKKAHEEMAAAGLSDMESKKKEG